MNISNYNKHLNKLKELGYTDMVDYVCDICRMTLEETDLLPHTNGGNFTYEALQKLKEVNASMGMMLENSSERLMKTIAHEKSPGKDPKRRLETIANAGKLKIPYTTGILIGIGETNTTTGSTIADKTNNNATAFPNAPYIYGKTLYPTARRRRRQAAISRRPRPCVPPAAAPPILRPLGRDLPLRRRTGLFLERNRKRIRQRRNPR